LDLTTPISARLRQRDTGLRTSADPALLVQSLLDLIVDEAMEVIDEYQGKILKLEHKVLLKPNMKTVRQLHILSGDLILHKRTLEPIRVMIYGLRRYDTDRCAALIEGAVDSSKVVGYMSHKSKIYLADVHDHMEYILTSLDMFTGIAENLINYTFNMASYEMNEVMRRLTLATIIFLPLTLLTGYFGMNFDNMWSVKHGHTDLVFWIIAIPVMLIVIPMFLYQDFERMFHYVAKKWSVKRVVKEKSA
jgi:Mg2+ and Co2+ transporter CorA